MKPYIKQLLGFLLKAIGLKPFKPKPQPLQSQNNQQFQVADVPHLACVDVEITTDMHKKEITGVISALYAEIEFPPMKDFMGGYLFFIATSAIDRLNFISGHGQYVLVFCSGEYRLAEVVLNQNAHTALRQVYENAPACGPYLDALRELDLRPMGITREYGF